LQNLRVSHDRVRQDLRKHEEGFEPGGLEARPMKCRDQEPV